MQKYYIYFNCNQGRLILLILRLVGLKLPGPYLGCLKCFGRQDTTYKPIGLKAYGLDSWVGRPHGRQYEILTPEIHNEYTIEYHILSKNPHGLY